jgi:pimeloyl-ACP methyl ester carboxylesterase
MKLRLYHHADGARVAYRETGTGPALALLHSALLTHRELEPAVEGLQHRFRVVLPDLPLHGDSEDRPRHAYTLDWMTDVLCGFLADTCGPRPCVGGHDLGALLALRAVTAGGLTPSRLVLMPSSMHRRSARVPIERTLGTAMRAAAVPGLDWTLSHVLPLALRPSRARTLSERDPQGAADLLRHARSSLAGNARRARAWGRAARTGWTRPETRDDLLDAYAGIACPVLLLWADRDPWHELRIAEEALDLLPDAQLRVLSGTGYLIAYDDPVGVAREIVAFCG